MNELIKRAEEFAKECSKGNEPGHNFSHIQRVRKMALLLAGSTKCDKVLVELLALLHDVEDYKLNSNHKISDFLQVVDIESDLKDKLLYILPRLSFSKYPRLDDDFPIEGKIVSDADRLDAIGAIGIARAFSYGGFHKREMYGSEDSTIKHFDNKLLKLDQYLYLDISKEIAKKRMKLLNEFYDEFIEEVK